MSVLSRNTLGHDLSIITVDHDPKTTPTAGVRGDLIIHESEGGFAVYYYKMTSLEDTEVQRIVKKHKYDFSGIPSSTDDKSKGYTVGSEVCNGTDFYKCCDSTIGSAVWKKLT